MKTFIKISLIILGLGLLLNPMFLHHIIGHYSSHFAAIMSVVGFFIICGGYAQDENDKSTITSNAKEFTVTYKGEGMEVSISFNEYYELSDIEKRVVDAVCQCSECEGEDSIQTLGNVSDPADYPEDWFFELN